MASIQKRINKDGSVSYRVQVRIKGQAPQRATFKRLTDARKWEQATEAAIRERRYFKCSEASKHTVSDMIDRYLERLAQDNHTDEFTGSKMCRVEKGTKAQRDFTRGFTGIYFTQHFYAENNDGQIRAGVRTEPPLPIGGDIQIKVGEKLYTLTSRDTPLDVAPSVPMNTAMIQKSMGKEYAESIKNMTEDIQKMSSPYRAYTGLKAKALLKDIANTEEEVKFRVVGVNTATSSTGSFVAGEDFNNALKACGIDF